jgi:outer membrane protein TolC
MMKYLTTLLATALLVGMSILPAAAQDELTLDDCIEIALRMRGTVLQTRGAEQIAAAGKRSALGAFLPRVFASYDYADRKTTDQSREEPVTDSMGIPTGEIVTTQLADFNSKDKSLSLSAQMSLLDFSNWFSYASARQAHAAAQLDVIGSELDLIYAVKSAYFAYLASDENVATNEEALKRSEEQLKLIESKYELGSASLSDVLKQRVQVGNDRIGLLRAQNLITTSKASLAYTVGLDALREYRFSTIYVEKPYSGTLNDAIKEAMENSPVIGSSEHELNANESAVKAAWSTYLPTLSGSARYSKSDGVQLGQFNQKSTTKSIGFSVDWTIFDGFIREENVVRQKVFRNNARAALADNTNLIVQNVKTAFLNVALYRQQSDVSEENVKSATEDLKITQEKYNLGAATILDLLESQVTLKEAEVQLIGVQFDLKTALADLDRRLGRR